MLCSLRRTERKKEEVGKVAIACWHLPFVEAVAIGPVENNAAAVIVTRGRPVCHTGLSCAIERVAGHPSEVRVVVVEQALCQVVDVEGDRPSGTAGPGGRRLIVIDDEISHRGPIVIFVADEDAGVGRNAHGVERLVRPRQEVERGYVSIDVVLDERKEVAKLDKMGRTAPNPARSRENITCGRVVVKLTVSRPLNDGRLFVARGAVRQMECLT